MTGFEVKLVAAVLVIIIAIVGGRTALRIETGERGRYRMTLGNALAGGVFLGAALIHLLAMGRRRSRPSSRRMCATCRCCRARLPLRHAAGAGVPGSHAHEGGHSGGIYPYILAMCYRCTR